MRNIPNMADYCSIHIRSDVRPELPENFLRDGMIEVRYTDNESPDRQASFHRLAKSGIVKRLDLPRYHWTFKSEGFVEGFDVYQHVSWILKQIHPPYTIPQLNELGFECLLQFYWEGNGTGGGPLVTPELGTLLMENNIGLQFGFYLQNR